MLANHTAEEILALSVKDSSNIYDFSDKYKNTFLKKNEIQEQIPNSLTILMDEKSFLENTTKANYIYTTRVGIAKDAQLVINEQFSNTYRKSVNNIEGLGLIRIAVETINSFLNLATTFEQKKEALKIRMITNEINATEITKGQREAKHHIFSYLFELINNSDFKSIDSFLKNKDVLALKYIYLLTILNITYKYRNELTGFKDFFNFIKPIAKAEMSDRDFELTFRYLNDDGLVS